MLDEARVTTRPDGRRAAIARLPSIRFGRGVSMELPEVIANRGDRVMIVTGRRSLSDARLRDIGTLLQGVGIATVTHVRVGSEPGPEVVDDLAAHARRTDANVVLGMGGGSVLDTAKAVAGLSPGTTSVMDHLEGVGRGIPYGGPSLPFVAVPTTAGTGSEATRNAVITRRGPHGFKRSFRDDRLIATDALVDPDLLQGAPRELIASNGLDALTQLLEAYTSTGASPFTDALAMDGLAAVRAGLMPWYADPDGHGAAPARGHMAWAALMSGICLANAGLGAIHGLAAPIGALLPIAHGAACGALLGPTVRCNIRALESRAPTSTALARYASVGRVLADLGPDASDTQAREALVGLLVDWAARLGTPRLTELGLRPADVPRVLDGISSSSMRGNPVVLSEAEMRSILLD